MNKFVFELETCDQIQQWSRVTLPFVRRRVMINSIHGGPAAKPNRMSFRIEASLTCAQASQIYHYLDKLVDSYDCTYFEKVEQAGYQVPLTPLLQTA